MKKTIKIFGIGAAVILVLMAFSPAATVQAEYDDDEIIALAEEILLALENFGILYESLGPEIDAIHAEIDAIIIASGYDVDDYEGFAQGADMDTIYEVISLLQEVFAYHDLLVATLEGLDDIFDDEFWNEFFDSFRFTFGFEIEPPTPRPLRDDKEERIREIVKELLRLDRELNIIEMQIAQLQLELVNLLQQLENAQTEEERQRILRRIRAVIARIANLMLIKAMIHKRMHALLEELAKLLKIPTTQPSTQPAGPHTDAC